MKNPGLAFLALFFLLSLCGGSNAASQTEGRKWAVIVGIDSYLKEVTELHCAVNDAERFRKALIDAADFKEENMFLLTSKEKGNRMPDKSNIVRWISYIKSKASPGDLFVFFFSGHGITMEKESYLLTIESDPFSGETLDVSALKVSDLKKIIEGMTAGRIMLFIDACRNDPRSGKGETDNLLTEKQSKDLVIKAGSSPGSSREESFSFTFLSCNVGQRSFEWREKGMGFFTYYLVKGLMGDSGARDENGDLTIGTLKRYLGREVMEAVQRERGTTVKQEPWVTGNASAGADDWIISRSGKMPSTPLTSGTAGLSDDQKGTAEEKAIALCSEAERSFKKGNYEEAIFDYSRAISLKPDHAAAYCDRARVYLKKGDYDHVISDCEKAISINPRNGAAFCIRAQVKRERGDYEGAILDCSKAIELDRDLADAYGERGLSRYFRGEYDQAIADCNKAVGLAPRSVGAYLRRATVLTYTGKYDEAIADANSALLIDPASAAGYAERGLAYRKKGDLNRALADYNKALELNPSYATAYSNRGYIYAERGEYERAISDFNSAIKMNPNYALYYLGRGNTYIEMKEYLKALADYNRAIELNPKLPNPYYSKGDICRELNLKQEAIEAFRKFIELASPYGKKFEDYIKKARKQIQELERKK